MEDESEDEITHNSHNDKLREIINLQYEINNLISVK